MELEQTAHAHPHHSTTNSPFDINQSHLPLNDAMAQNPHISYAYMGREIYVLST